MECQLKANKSNCNCTYEPCPRKGKCCDCIAYHLQFDELPACVFPSEVEKSYDRSTAKFVEVFAYKARGANKG
ncbi:DUF6485 family protein [Chloroflexota bacterium]